MAKRQKKGAHVLQYISWECSMLFTYLCSSQYSDHDLVHAKKWKVCLLNHTVYKHMITSSILTILDLGEG